MAAHAKNASKQGQEKGQHNAWRTHVKELSDEGEDVSNAGSVKMPCLSTAAPPPAMFTRISTMETRDANGRVTCHEARHDAPSTADAPSPLVPADWRKAGYTWQAAASAAQACCADVAAWAAFARQLEKGNALLAKDPRDGGEEWHKATVEGVHDGARAVTVSHDGWGPRHDQELAVDLGLMKPLPQPAPAPHPVQAGGRSKRKTAGTHSRWDRQAAKKQGTHP